jgi:hypothetical protein
MKHYFLSAQRVLPAELDKHELWISGKAFAQNLNLLRENNITAICSVLKK